MKQFFLSALVLATTVFVANAEEPQQPYLEEIRKTLPPDTHSSSESYTEKVKKGLSQEPSGGYIDAIKNSLPPEDASKTSSEGYSEKKRAELEPKDEEEVGAIQKVKEGRSELELKKRGPIHYAGGFRVGATATRDFVATGSSAKRKFSEIYGTGWTPDIHLNFELQPFHSEWLGNVGFFTDAGFAYFKGTGKFAVELPKPNGAGSYGTVSKTQFRFTQIPITAGANYRFNLFRLFRPYAQAGYQAVGYSESRSDSKSGYKGYSTGAMVGGGVAILMDWMSSRSSAAYYNEFSIKHYYLVLDYTKIKTISGEVDFSSSLLSAGFLFEL